MKPWFLALTLSGAGFWAPAAQAQFITPFRPVAPSRPVLNPILNLNRGGLAGINYYNLVRPQLNTARDLQTLNEQVQTLQTGTPTDGLLGASPVPNYMYYPNFPAMPAGGVHPLTRRR